MPGFSSAEAGDCKVSENKTPSCHLNWYDLSQRRSSVELSSWYNDVLSDITRNHLDKYDFQYLEDMREPERRVSSDDYYWGRIQPEEGELSSFHYALGYLSIFDPSEYKIEPVVQSVSLLLAASVAPNGTDRDTQNLLILLDSNADHLLERLSSDDGVEQKELYDPRRPSEPVAISLSGRGCVDIRILVQDWLSQTTALLLKTSHSPSGAPRC